MMNFYCIIMNYMNINQSFSINHDMNCSEYLKVKISHYKQND